MSGAGREAIVFTTCYVMQWGAKAGHTVGVAEINTWQTSDAVGLECPNRSPSSSRDASEESRVQSVEGHGTAFIIPRPRAGE